MLQEIINNSIARKSPKIYEKYEYVDGKSQVVNSKKSKIYDYYICDCCKEEIKIENDKNKMTGGIVDIPSTLTRNKPIRLALHNNCINKVIAQFSERNMINDNKNHIPSTEGGAIDEVES